MGLAGRIKICTFLLTMSYSKHYMYAFEPRNLKAFSAEPLMIYPTHYTGEANYITDTGESCVLLYHLMYL